jgi:hypothetical protein
MHARIKNVLRFFSLWNFTKKMWSKFAYKINWITRSALFHSNFRIKFQGVFVLRSFPTRNVPYSRELTLPGTTKLFRTRYQYNSWKTRVFVTVDKNLLIFSTIVSISPFCEATPSLEGSKLFKRSITTLKETSANKFIFIYDCDVSKLFAGLVYSFLKEEFIVSLNKWVLFIFQAK